MGKKKPTFEEALTRLEEIVTGIEAGDIPLEQSIEKYAEGIALIKQCRRILARAEQKIQLLAANSDGSLAADGALAEDDQDE